MEGKLARKTRNAVLLAGLIIIGGLYGGVKNARAIECRNTGMYEFNGGDFVKVAGRSGGGLVVKEGEELLIEAGGGRFSQAALARARLFYPDGRLYQSLSLKLDGQDGKGRYVWKGSAKLEKKFKQLVAEVSLTGSRSHRRGRLRKNTGMIYFQTMMAVSDEFLPKTDWGFNCWLKDLKGSVVLAGKYGDVVEAKGWLIDRFKNRQRLKQFEYAAGDGQIEFNLVVDQGKAAGWHDVQIDLLKREAETKKLVKEAVVVPIDLIMKGSRFELTAPEAGGQLDGEVEVAGQGSSQTGVEAAGWYRKAASDSWQSLGEDVRFEAGEFNQVFWSWPTDDLEPGKYQLKVRFASQAGEVKEVEVDDLIKEDSSRRFGIKVAQNIKLPEMIVSTFDQVIEGWLGGSGDKKTIMIVDDRSSQPGWVLTGVFEDLYAPKADYFIKAAGLLTIKPGAVDAVQGSLDGVTAGGEVMIKDDGQPVVISQAQQGHGRGVYKQGIFLRWLIPANTPAGDYQGTIVFTLQ
ncbi:MAG: hypothetical protein GXP43_00455 [bacterium]|nr:hypothetical protein [bacterium]